MSGRRVGPWGSIPRPTTAGSSSWTAMAPRSCGPGSGGCRGWPMPTSPLVEQRVVAFALGHPGFGPARIAAELARPKWGGIVLSTNGVWRVLRRHGLSTRAKRYGLVAGYAAPPRACSGPSRPLSGTWRSTTPASWSSSTASASAGSAAPRAPSGSTPPSTSPPPTPGPPCRSPAATPRPPGPASSPAQVAADLAEPRLEAGAGHERQRPGVPLGHLPARPSPPSAPATASSGPAGPRPTAVSSGSSRPSWTSAGSPPSPAT